MRYTITNNSKAPRGVHNAAGRLVFIQPGESRTMEVAKIGGVRRLSSMTVTVCETLPTPPADLVAAVAKMDHDGDGFPGGSKAPPKTDDIKAARSEYEKKMGKRPFPGWDVAELKRRMAAA